MSADQHSSYRYQHSIPSTHFTTATLPPEVRSEAWRSVIGGIYDVCPDARAEDVTLEGALSSHVLDSLLVGTTAFNAQRYDRDHRLIRATDLEQYLVQFFLTGDFVAHVDDREVRVRPGDACILDLGRTVSAIAAPGETCSIVVPRAQLDKQLGVARNRSGLLHGHVLRQEDARTRLLRAHLVSLNGELPHLTMDDAPVLAEVTLSMLAAALDGRSQHLTGRRATLDTEHLRDQVLAFIEAHLRSSELDAGMLQREFGLSRASLYRLLAADGGVATLIRRRRLDGAYRELRHERLAQSRRTIVDIALAWGFTSEDQFTRSFKARFAMTPGETRRAELPPRLPSIHEQIARHAKSFDSGEH